MKNETKIDPFRALEELLDLERKAVLDGQLGQLENLLPEKEKLFDSLGKSATGRSEQVQRVQKKLERNQALLESAADGVRAVFDRMAELRRVRQGLHTYDAAGKRNSFPVRLQTQLEKKA
ncbi:flagellar biosynthesis protein FlgN [Ruegeria marisrubri]|uniref:Flagellar biosynthesis protein FlgN n=1 Tax=Ruegeria marisrubri TaxID=1685379 RepID=A0A0X3TQ63_9RHOB|nr:flagellar biosynthesis protein FlgN [Ruegeria marisrubri]KUJ77905.1 flagellar biosynthesis protein FlgN [Ruegeria marisrubri]